MNFTVGAMAQFRLRPYSAISGLGDLFQRLASTFFDDAIRQGFGHFPDEFKMLNRVFDFALTQRAVLARFEALFLNLPSMPDVAFADNQLLGQFAPAGQVRASYTAVRSSQAIQARQASEKIDPVLGLQICKDDTHLDILLVQFTQRGPRFDENSGFGIASD